jgi:hypothetical protein
MLRLLLWAVGGFVGLAIAYLAWFAIVGRPRRRTEPGFEYIWVDDDGEARELDAHERDYLSTTFHPADSGRPYIKIRYESRTPDGRLSGYLRRRQLPGRVRVRA